MKVSETKAKLEGKILLPMDNGKLVVLNNCMASLDGLTFSGIGRQLKTPVSICWDLRTELLQKAIKTRQKDKSFILKLAYYKADALYRFLNDFEIYFPDSFGPYENNTVMQLKNELHQQLQ